MLLALPRPARVARDARPPAAGGEAPVAAARIGPNAIIQSLRALEARCGASTAALLAAEAACPARLDTMVDERHFVRLVNVLHRRLGPGDALAVLDDAGRRTAAYVLAHRIPRRVARLLPLLPAGIALPLVVAAIRRHAWTFAGGGTLRWTPRPQPALTLDECPTCRDRRAARPVGAFYAAAFEALLRALVHDRLRVAEVECVAAGGRSCRFAVSLPARAPRIAEPPLHPDPRADRCASC